MESITRKVTLMGIRPILFDRYPGDNKTVLMPEQKMYLGDQNELIFPALNIQSFLSAENTKSAVKSLYDSRQYKKIAQAVLGFVIIEPFQIPFNDDKGKPIIFKGFGKNGITCIEHVARLSKGVPNPKKRPQLDTPWNLEFRLTLYKNDDIDELGVRMLFEKGGLLLGFGTYRGVYGKFVVSNWK